MGNNRGKRGNSMKGKTYEEIYGPEMAEKLKQNLSLKLKNELQNKPRQHSDEVKKKISDAMKGNRNANHRGDRQSYYLGIRMDSSWETRTAEYFDKNKINWKYSVKGYRLSDGKYYYPDFFIYDETNKLIKLIEVKGYFREENRKKFEKFKTEYPEIIIELWDSKVLKEKKIL